MSRIRTLGYVAYEQHCKNVGQDASGWGMRYMTCAREGWERIAQAVRQQVVSELASSGNPHSAATKRSQRERQGGMVNVHTKPPLHYNAHPSGVECIEVTRHLPFNLGNVVKYIWRAGLKENESEIKDLEKSLDYLNDEINKRKLALGIKPEAFTRFGQEQERRGDLESYRGKFTLAELNELARSPKCQRAWGYRFETQPDARVPAVLRTDNRDPNARCGAGYCHGATKYDRDTGGPNAFVRMPYYYCLPCLVAMGELNADGSHKHAGGDK